MYIYIYISCVNFWEEAWWFLSLRVFGLLSSSLLLFPRHFCWHVLHSSSGFCPTNTWRKIVWKPLILYIYIYILSSSCRAIRTDISDPLSTLLPIVHCFWPVFRAISSICTELLDVCLRRTSCLCSSLWRGPQTCITYELVPTSPAVSRMYGSSNFDSFCDGW